MLSLAPENWVVLGAELQTESAVIGLNFDRLRCGLCFSVHIDFSRFYKGFGFYQLSSKPWEAQDTHSVNEAVETI
jgi:hypothetical protein